VATVIALGAWAWLGSQKCWWERPEEVWQRSRINNARESAEVIHCGYTQDRPIQSNTRSLVFRCIMTGMPFRGTRLVCHSVLTLASTFCPQIEGFANQSRTKRYELRTVLENEAHTSAQLCASCAR